MPKVVCNAPGSRSWTNWHCARGEYLPFHVERPAPRNQGRGHFRFPSRNFSQLQFVCGCDGSETAGTSRLWHRLAFWPGVPCIGSPGQNARRCKSRELQAGDRGAGPRVISQPAITNSTIARCRRASARSRRASARSRRVSASRRSPLGAIRVATICSARTSFWISCTAAAAMPATRSCS